MTDAEVLIVGAGPTGLALALFLTHSGLKPRIVENSSGPGETSRAMGVHARTLEFYRQLGFADEAVRRGIKMERIHLREGDREVARFELAEFGEGISPYPFVLSLPQDDHERLLVERLAAAGVAVQWNTTLVGFADEETHVRATIQTAGAEEETLRVAYLCGCDGAHSTVRRGLRLDFEGGTYPQVFFVADVEATGAAVDNEDVNACLGRGDFCLVFPIRSSGMHRFIGVVPRELEGRETLTFEDVRPFVERLIDVRVRRVNWFAHYQSHHRVAGRFRVGRVFILGDAGHIHSPAGGQGMNTGIGDAVNLAWKLAAVLDGRASPRLLDTYEPERIAFARTLVATTDRAFRFVAGRNAGGEIFRELIAPHLAPFVLGFNRVKNALFRTVSQTSITYRHSELSTGCAGDVCGGDRLPWVPGDDVDNFASLTALDWQIHTYGEANDALRRAASDAKIPLYELPWTAHAGEAGLERDALYLVRPDGYVALADAAQDVSAMFATLSAFEIVARRP